MGTLTPVLIKLSIALAVTLMRTYKTEKGGTQTQGEAAKTDSPIPNEVSH